MFKQRGSALNRRVDGLLGTPALVLLGGLRAMRDVPHQIDRVGIISCAALGDTILASAIARDIKQALPGCTVIAFIAPVSRGISQIVEGFDREVVLPVTQPREALAALHANPVSALLDVMPWPRITALLAGLSRAEYTVGFRTPGTRRHYLYDAAMPHSARRHEVENFRRLLAPLDIAGGCLPRRRPRLEAAAASEGDDPLVVLHPWASGYRSAMREWAQDRWVALAHRLLAEGRRLAITGGPADRPRSEQLAAAIGGGGHVEVLAGRATLLDTALAIAAADAVVSVNTGVMHLAAALGRPLVALHGPTDPARWGPLGRRVRIVGPDRERGGAYLNLGFEYPPDPPDCMGMISVEEVCAALADLDPPSAPDVEAETLGDDEPAGAVYATH